MNETRRPAAATIDQAAEAIEVEAAKWQSWEAGEMPDCVDGLYVAHLLGADPFELFCGPAGTRPIIRPAKR